MKAVRISAVWLCAAAGLAAQSAPAAGTGNITGTVTDNGGSAVEGALVTANSMPTTRAATMNPVAVTTVSGNSGAFEIDGLAPGLYKICVSKPGAGLLDPCAWADGLPWAKGSTLIAVANVTAGGTARGITAVAIRGATITVRVADSANVIGQSGGMSDILVGVRHGGAPFIPTGPAATDSTGKTYSLVIPQGKAASVSVYSKAFVLADQNGKEYSTSEVSIPVPASATTASAGVAAAGTASSNGSGSVGSAPGSAAAATVTVNISRPANSPAK